MYFSNSLHEANALPTPREELLLQAAIQDPALAAQTLAAWKEASSFVNYDQIDFADARLLPMVYRNLFAAESSDPWLPQLAALSKYHWFRNAACQRDVLEVANAFSDANIDHVVLGGLSLVAAGNFDDLGERPAIDRQIYIRTSQARTAGNILALLGWKPPRSLPPVAGWRRLECWTRGEENVLQVCFQYLPKGFPIHATEAFLLRSERTKLGNVEIRIPDATDRLHIACVAGRRCTADGSFRTIWAADTARILQRASSPFDWNRLLADAQELKTLYPLRESLAYLRQTFGLSVPEEFLKESFAIPLSDADREPFRTHVGTKSPPIWSRSAKTLARPYRDYLAAEMTAERSPTLRGMMKYWGWRIQSEVSRSRKAA